MTAKRKNDWQDTDKVLGIFGEKAGLARRAYRAFVEKGITQGKRSDLTGGGLVRSAGGWAAVRELGITMSSLARKLKISVPAVSKSAIRGEKLAEEISRRKHPLSRLNFPRVHSNNNGKK